MFPLRFEREKYYIGEIEVLPFPVGGSIGITLGFEKGKIPPLEELLTKLVSDAYKQGVNLTKANCYTLAMLRAERIAVPEQQVADGEVSEKREKYMVVQFYKAVPATEEKRRALEQMFSSSI